MPIAAIELIRDLCWLIYAGAFLANSLYLMFAAKEKKQQQLDSFLNLGSVLGLSLGGTIFCALSIWFVASAVLQRQADGRADEKSIASHFDNPITVSSEI